MTNPPIRAKTGYGEVLHSFMLPDTSELAGAITGEARQSTSIIL